MMIQIYHDIPWEYRSIKLAKTKALGMSLAHSRHSNFLYSVSFSILAFADDEKQGHFKGLVSKTNPPRVLRLRQDNDQRTHSGLARSQYRPCAEVSQLVGAPVRKDSLEVGKLGRQKSTKGKMDLNAQDKY